MSLLHGAKHEDWQLFLKFVTICVISLCFICPLLVFMNEGPLKLFL
jgi:hypothetical protein